MKKITLFVCFSLALGSTLLQARTIQSSSSQDDKVEFQVMPDSRSYKPGRMMRVKFVIINHGTTPLYIGRGLGACSKWTGHSEFQILNEKDEDTIKVGCSMQIGPVDDKDLAHFMNDNRRWLRLDPGETYSTEELFKLSTKAGRYQLKAELWPPGFSDRQRESLANQQIRVLKSRHPAPVVTVTVR